MTTEVVVRTETLSAVQAKLELLAEAMRADPELSVENTDDPRWLQLNDLDTVLSAVWENIDDWARYLQEAFKEFKNLFFASEELPDYYSRFADFEDAIDYMLGNVDDYFMELEIPAPPQPKRKAKKVQYLTHKQIEEDNFEPWYGHDNKGPPEGVSDKIDVLYYGYGDVYSNITPTDLRWEWNKTIPVPADIIGWRRIVDRPVVLSYGEKVQKHREYYQDRGFTIWNGQTDQCPEPRRKGVVVFADGSKHEADVGLEVYAWKWEGTPQPNPHDIIAYKVKG